VLVGFVQVAPVASRVPGLFPEGALTKARFLWAMAIVGMRSFGSVVDGERTTIAMIPLMDSFNHRAGLVVYLRR